MKKFLFNNKYEALAVMAQGWEQLKNNDCKVYTEDEYGTVMRQHNRLWYKDEAIAGHKVYLVVNTVVDSHDPYAIQNAFRVAIVADEHREAYVKNMATERQVVVECDKPVAMPFKTFMTVAMPFKTFINKVADVAWNIGRNPKTYGEVTAVWAMDTFHDLYEAERLAGSF